jgi:hypothetical protein
MQGSLDEVLAALERVSNEMAHADGVPIDELVRLVARRQTLVDRIAAFQPLAPSVCERLGSIVRKGAIAEGRLNAAREALRMDIENMSRMQRFAGGLSQTVPERRPRLNTRG